MNRDIVAGAFLISVGGAALLLVGRLQVEGGAADASYFPRLIGWAIIIMGLVIAAQGWLYRMPFEPWALRPLLALVAGTLTFGLLIQRGGLLLAATCCALVGSLAAPFPGWKQRMAAIAAICVGAAVIFKYLLRLPVSLFPV